MKKSSENFWRTSGAQKKDSQIFRLRRPFIVVEVLKTVKTAKNRYIFEIFRKTVKFLKKGPQNFLIAAGFILK